MGEAAEYRTVVWLGPTLDEVRAMPDDVQDKLGFALDRIQLGLPHRAVSLSSEIPGVGKIRVNHDTNTYRVYFVVTLGTRVYVLHAFQKKSTDGRATPRYDLALVQTRLAQAKEHAHDR